MSNEFDPLSQKCDGLSKTLRLAETGSRFTIDDSRNE